MVALPRRPVTGFVDDCARASVERLARRSAVEVDEENIFDRAAWIADVTLELTTATRWRDGSEKKTKR